MSAQFEPEPEPEPEPGSSNHANARPMRLTWPKLLLRIIAMLTAMVLRLGGVESGSGSGSGSGSN